MTPDFSAASSNLGYLHQLRVALLKALEDESFELRLEVLDDVEVVRPNSGTAFLQLKHVNATANLTDSSADLWKTLRVWSEHKSAGRIDPADRLVLVTTGRAPPGSIASKLANPGADWAAVVADLVGVAQASSNRALQPAFDAFLSLSSADKLDLVSRISVIDQAPNISDITALISRQLALAVGPEHRELTRERLEGWWFGEAIRHLSGETPSIHSAAVFSKARDIGDSFGPDALPLDFFDLEPPGGVDPRNDRRPFVSQLHSISVSFARIEKAMLDYYRAFEQRARWVREDLVVDGEIDDYERRLVDEWERVRLAIEDELDLDAADEGELQRAGRELLTWVEQKAELPLRARTLAPYVTRGSYHMLANEGPSCRIWWHPKFQERVSDIFGLDPGGPDDEVDSKAS